MRMGAGRKDQVVTDFTDAGEGSTKKFEVTSRQAEVAKQPRSSLLKPRTLNLAV